MNTEATNTQTETKTNGAEPPQRKRNGGYIAVGTVRTAEGLEIVTCTSNTKKDLKKDIAAKMAATGTFFDVKFIMRGVVVPHAENRSVNF